MLHNLLNNRGDRPGQSEFCRLNCILGLFARLTTKPRANLSVDAFKRFWFETAQGNYDRITVQRKQPCTSYPTHFRQPAFYNIIVL